MCVHHCVVLPLAKATKASIYLAWASNLIERRALKGRQPSHVPGWHGFSLVNTSVLHPECTPHNPRRREGLLLLTKWAKKKYICSIYLHFFGWITMHHLTRWKANILSQAWETHPINEAFFHPLVSLTGVTAHHKEQPAQNTICQFGGRQGPFIHVSHSSVSIYSVFSGLEKETKRNFRTLLCVLFSNLQL